MGISGQKTVGSLRFFHPFVVYLKSKRAESMEKSMFLSRRSYLLPGLGTPAWMSGYSITARLSLTNQPYHKPESSQQYFAKLFPNCREMHLLRILKIVGFFALFCTTNRLLHLDKPHCKKLIHCKQTKRE